MITKLINAVNRTRLFLSIVYRPDWIDGSLIRPRVAWEVAKIIHEARR